MQREHWTRREVGVALTALVSVLAWGRSVRAFPFEKVPGYDSADQFKQECKAAGGTFDAGTYSTSCTYKGGPMKVCDEKGKNCTWHPAGAPGSGGPFADPSQTGGEFSEQPAATPANPPRKRTKRRR